MCQLEKNNVCLFQENAMMWQVPKRRCVVQKAGIVHFETYDMYF